MAGAPPAPAALFGSGYLLRWGGIGAPATALQWGLESARLPSPMLATTSHWRGPGILVAAGLWQLTPLKVQCLRHCRPPLGFLLGSWRAGRFGALRMELKHGAHWPAVLHGDAYLRQLERTMSDRLSVRAALRDPQWRLLAHGKRGLLLLVLVSHCGHAWPVLAHGDADWITNDPQYVDRFGHRCCGPEDCERIPESFIRENGRDIYVLPTQQVFRKGHRGA